MLINYLRNARRVFSLSLSQYNGNKKMIFCNVINAKYYEAFIRGESIFKKKLRKRIKTDQKQEFQTKIDE